eukprot:537777-Rhodomonas_salina.2
MGDTLRLKYRSSLHVNGYARSTALEKRVRAGYGDRCTSRARSVRACLVNYVRTIRVQYA